MRQRARSCFLNFTPFAVQTLPAVAQYAQVQRALRKLKQSFAALGSQDDRKEGHSSGGRSGSHAAVVAVRHPATHVAPLPSLQQQLSKAITNRMITKPAAVLSASVNRAAGSFGAGSSAERSLASLVTHDAPSTLAYLLNLLDLQSFPQLVAAAQHKHHHLHAGVGGAGAGDEGLAALALSARELQRVQPSLLLVNEETKLRKQVLQAVRTSNSSPASTATVGSGSASNARLDALPYFETLVRLFDQQAPQLLPAFVRLMDELFGAKASSSSSAASSSSSMASAMPPPLQSVLLSPLEMASHLERALHVLPPISTLTLSAAGLVRRTATAAATGHTAGGEGTGSTDDTAAMMHGETSGALVHHADSSDEKNNGSAHSRALSSLAKDEQLRLDRISSRCALLVLSGRPVDAVLLCLRMADEDADSSQEEMAILLAGAIVREAERAAMQGGGQEQQEEDLAVVRDRLAPTFALRDELFQHLFTNWLQRQFTLQLSAHPSLLSSSASSADLASLLSSRLSLSSLPRLDPRVSALMSPSFGTEAYFERISQEKLAFVQRQVWRRRDEEEAAQRGQKQQQQQSSGSGAAAQAAPAATKPHLWPVLSPLLLPSPGSIQAQQAALLPQSRESADVDVDLPMSCFLAELKAFAARE